MSEELIERVREAVIAAAQTGGGSYRRDIDCVAGNPTRIARAALEAARYGEPAWQPIETAPRDGTEILVVHRENRSFLQIVGWEYGNTAYKWCSPDGPDYHENAFDFWMPLPEPPHALLSSIGASQP